MFKNCFDWLQIMKVIIEISKIILFLNILLSLVSDSVHAGNGKYYLIKC